MRVAVLSTISSVSCEKTKYSPGERPTSSVTRRLAVSMSSTASIQTGVPRRSFLNISKGVARIEQPSFDRIQDWVLVGDASYDCILAASLPIRSILAYLSDCKRLARICIRPLKSSRHRKHPDRTTTPAFFTYLHRPVAMLQFASQNTHSIPSSEVPCIAAS